ncbi:putative signal transduction histidine kinase [Niastella koreensis GR20-10]|uniref:histidine kinase n=2 Tax=Niastella koreensis TaxID=354356 RepID=G8TH38_NIAKG|nr:PAS domain S-box protein [Niastella koreensis]AEW00649.1 putative signal transduction histidine kinase [Niastella koreensis GR20-10]
MQTSSVTHSDIAMQATIGPNRNTTAAAILNGVIENTEGYTWIVDKNLQYIVCNGHLRYTLKQLSGRDVLPGDEVIDCLGMLDPTQHLPWPAIYQEAFNGTAQRFTHQLSIQQKTVFYDIRITPVREDNRIIALSCSALDITERKRAEEGLRQSELKFRSLIENSTDIITMANEEGNIFYGSPSAKNILGYEEADYMGRHVCSFIHPDSLPAVNELLQNLMQHPDELFTIDLKVFDKQGNERWVLGMASNMLQMPGINALVGNFRDITERKKAEELIKESEDLYKNLFYNSPLPKAICDAATMQLLEVNEATTQLYGYSRKEFMQMKVNDIVSPDEQLNSQEFLPKLDNLNRSSILRRHVKKNGETIFVEVWGHAINYKGRTAWMLQANDITDKIELQNQLVEKEIQRRQEVAKAVIDAQEKERTTLGRELHDNISQMLGTAKLYLNCALDTPAMKDDMITRSRNAISDVVEEIRRLSKSMIETFNKAVGLELSLNDLIQKVRAAQPFTISLYFAVPDEPQLDDKLKMTIFRIVQELLNNAIKHANATEVQVAIVQKNRQLLLTIADDGNGFDTTQKSTGIGITNIISRAELFNGRIKIESSPGKGCRMQVRFTI